MNRPGIDGMSKGRISRSAEQVMFTKRDEKYEEKRGRRRGCDYESEGKSVSVVCRVTLDRARGDKVSC